MTHTLRTILLAALVVGTAGRLSAQAIGSIRGTVVDTSQAIINGATVLATNSATGVSRSEVSNQDGIFVFPDLPIGTYQLQISKNGFQTQKHDGIVLLTGQTLDLQLPLSVGPATQSVEVTSAAPLIQTASSSIQTSVDQKQMQDLPLNGRNPLQLTTLTPGTALTNTGTESGQQDNVGLTVNGLRATQNNFQLDGAIYNDRFFDSVPILPNPDALQEFTVQSSNYSSEYAGAGALVQLSTRSGTNDLHGSAYEFLRNTVLDAKNYFQQTAPPFKLNQFGGMAGGPIIKNRTFFFFAAEDLQQRSSPNPISIQVPTAAELNGNFFALLARRIASVSTRPRALPIRGNIINTRDRPAVTKSWPRSIFTGAPLAANPTTGIFNSTSNQNIDSTQYLAKIDHTVYRQQSPQWTLLSTTRTISSDRSLLRPDFMPKICSAINLLIITDTQVFSPTFHRHICGQRRPLRPHPDS